MLSHDKTVAGMPTKSISLEANCISLRKYINYVDTIDNVSNVIHGVDVPDGCGFILIRYKII